LGRACTYSATRQGRSAHRGNILAITASTGTAVTWTVSGDVHDLAEDVLPSTTGDAFDGTNANLKSIRFLICGAAICEQGAIDLADGFRQSLFAEADGTEAPGGDTDIVNEESTCARGDGIRPDHRHLADRDQSGAGQARPQGNRGRRGPARFLDPCPGSGIPAM
jgi:hypothetical protein